MNTHQGFASRVAGSMAFAALLIMTGSARGGSSTWTFDGGINQKSGASAIDYYKGATTSSAVSFVSSTINGQNATVMSIPAFNEDQGLALSPNVGPNGGSTGYINQYTFGFDVNVTGSNWFAFYQTSSTNANDADFFKQPSGGIGIGGNYSGSIPLNTWARVMFTVDETTAGGGTMNKYIDGVLAGTQSLGDSLDGRFSLYSNLQAASPTLLFTSINSEADTAPALINAVYFNDSVLDASQIAEFRGASAKGFVTAAAAVPEPSSAVLLGAGLALAAAALRRRTA